MRVTEKGQVTIPKPIRDKLGIGPGSEVEFRIRRDEVVVEAGQKENGRDDPAGHLLKHIDRHADSFDLDGMQADDVVRFLRD